MSNLMASGVLGFISCLFTTSAFILSLVTVFTCDFVRREIVLGSNAQTLYNTFCNFFPDASICDDRSVGIGFWASKHSDGHCIPYKIRHSSSDGSTVTYEPGFDSKWNAARTFAAFATLSGAVLFVALVWAQRYRFPPTPFKVIAGLLLLTTLFQGLSFLIYNSDQCNSTSYSIFGSSFDIEYDCSPSVGSRCGEAATALYFVAGLLCCALGAASSSDVVESGNGYDAF